jgi:3-dehydroquinate synthase
MVVTTQAVKRAGHVKVVLSVLKKFKIPVSLCVIPNGESQKNISTLKYLYEQGFKAGLDRKSLIVALGGGVITDLAGFFASTYMRGIGYVSIPTTMLAMVDAAIGGKTGIDLKEGKNLVGTFWQPRMVFINSHCLETLPLREWKTGMAEIIKYGVIRDKSFFDWLEKEVRNESNIQNWNSENIASAIFKSGQIKSHVVAQDERETPLAGGREILNFGHTVGHALESVFNYGRFSHGEAISIGMNIAGQIALELGQWSFEEQIRLIQLLDHVGLPVWFPRLSTDQKKKFWSALHKDKKHISGKLRFVLPKKMGTVEVKSGIPLSVIEKAIQSCTVEKEL